MITWNFIKNLPPNKTLPEAVINTRSKSMQEKYIDWKSKNSETDLYDILFKNTDRDYAVLLNDFPYDLEDGILHYVIWFRPDQSTYDNVNIDNNILTDPIDPILLSDILNSIEHTDYICFKNNKHLRTVKSIDHYHLIVKTL